MKKLYLIWIFVIFLATHLTFANETSYSQKYLEDRYWEFIKERLFDGRTQYYSAFPGDITISLINATRPDSLIVQSFCTELRQLIPKRKIQLIRPSADLRPSIVIMFNYSKNLAYDPKQFIYISADLNGYQVSQWGHNSYFYKLTQYSHIQFKDTISFAERKQYIEFAIVRSLCYIKGNSQDARVFIEGAILNDFGFNPQHTRFTDVDKFVLSKLYSGNFREQFRVYMINKYSWLKYMNFIDADSMKFRSYILSIILGLLILINLQQCN